MIILIKNLNLCYCQYCKCADWSHFSTARYNVSRKKAVTCSVAHITHMHCRTKVLHVWLVEKLYHLTVRSALVENLTFLPGFLWSGILSLKISQLESEFLNRIIPGESLAFKNKICLHKQSETQSSSKRMYNETFNVRTNHSLWWLHFLGVCFTCNNINFFSV